MRALIAVALLSSLAHADASVPLESRTFDRFVRDLAARRGQRLLASWTVNLDREPDLELVAVLYDGDGDRGDFIIEKRGRQRWDVRFYADGRTLPNANGEIVPPPSEQPFYRGPHARRPQTILYRTGHRGGYDDVLLALRGGRVAVVYEEGLDDARESTEPIAIDWDAQVRRKEARYRFIEPGNEPDDNGGLALRRLD
jgi:hypothetical protein